MYGYIFDRVDMLFYNEQNCYYNDININISGDNSYAYVVMDLRWTWIEEKNSMTEKKERERKKY